jgi:hypothetical protein
MALCLAGRVRRTAILTDFADAHRFCYASLASGSRVQRDIRTSWDAQLFSSMPSAVGLRDTATASPALREGPERSPGGAFSGQRHDS